jgi:hypothetical protein
MKKINKSQNKSEKLLLTIISILALVFLLIISLMFNRTGLQYTGDPINLNNLIILELNNKNKSNKN